MAYLIPLQSPPSPPPINTDTVHNPDKLNSPNHAPPIMQQIKSTFPLEYHETYYPYPNDYTLHTPLYFILFPLLIFVIFSLCTSIFVLLSLFMFVVLCYTRLYLFLNLEDNRYPCWYSSRSVCIRSSIRMYYVTFVS